MKLHVSLTLTLWSGIREARTLEAACALLNSTTLLPLRSDDEKVPPEDIFYFDDCRSRFFIVRSSTLDHEKECEGLITFVTFPAFRKGREAQARCFVGRIA
jgi:hypothetical protein